jgi:hypothetical protein
MNKIALLNESASGDSFVITPIMHRETCVTAQNMT